MLEALRERSQSWIAKLILVLITVPFAIAGIDSYLSNVGSKATLAEINNESISIQEFGKALQDQRDSMEGKVDPNYVNNPKVRQAVLDRLINQKLLAAEVKRAGHTVTDEQLYKLIVAMPEFQKDGKFSQEIYDQLLASNGMTPSVFESRMRKDLLSRQIQQAVASMAFMPAGAEEQALKAKYQTREISVATIHADDYLGRVKVDPAAAKTYYDQHQDEFRVPEQVKLEYLVLSVNHLVTGIQVSDEEVQRHFQENAAKYQGDEERRASHILIAVGGKKDSVAREEAKQKALKVLEQAKKSPENFAELAKQYSQDPGSAQNGGDLGVVKRGVMVKPFEDAVFAMAPGSISDLVETDFGYHIIRLTELKGATQDLEQKKPEIRGELMYQKALAKFAEVAETFSNLVYEQSTSLEPAATQFKLQPQKSDWLSREDAAKFFKNNDRLAAAIFSDEVRKEGRNTEAVEVGPNTLVACRVIDSRPASFKPFEDVKTQIEEAIRKREAAVMAAAEGDKALGQLKQGQDAPSLLWSAPVLASRHDPQGLTESVVATAFKMNVAKLPSYTGATSSDGSFVMIKISAVEDGASTLDQDSKQRSQAELNMQLSSEYLAAYIKSLRSSATIKINEALLLKTE